MINSQKNPLFVLKRLEFLAHVLDSCALILLLIMLNGKKANSKSWIVPLLVTRRWRFYESSADGRGATSPWRPYVLRLMWILG